MTIEIMCDGDDMFVIRDGVRDRQTRSARNAAGQIVDYS